MPSHHHGVLGQPPAREPVDGGDRDDLIAVDQTALGVHREDAVGIAVERDADIGTPCHDGALQIIGMGRSASRVDVGAVRFVVDHLDGGAQRPQDLRSDGGG